MKILNKIKELGEKAADGMLKVLGIELKEDKKLLLVGFILAVSSLVVMTLLVNLFR